MIAILDRLSRGCGEPPLWHFSLRKYRFQFAVAIAVRPEWVGPPNLGISFRYESVTGIIKGGHVINVLLCFLPHREISSSSLWTQSKPSMQRWATSTFYCVLLFPGPEIAFALIIILFTFVSTLLTHSPVCSKVASGHGQVHLSRLNHRRAIAANENRWQFVIPNNS